jgi:hypothetical protein
VHVVISGFVISGFVISGFVISGFVISSSQSVVARRSAPKRRAAANGRRGRVPHVLLVRGR